MSQMSLIHPLAVGAMFCTHQGRTTLSLEPGRSSSRKSINFLELLAVRCALETFAVSNASITLLIDNTSALFIVNKGF